jgi:hypothetical protein
MGCNCTANLRADIIKRFFANQFNGKEFALELIRIVECQQTVMSRELEDWFKVWFRFPQDMLEEFLACVMKRQQTMSDRLQKVIRARFFPTDQRMADDFIRVVLCGCCPTLCGTDVNIINTSDQYTVDGWYMQVDASNLVYMEADTIIETVPCESGLADFKITSGAVTFAPAVWHNGQWDGAIAVELIGQDLGNNFTLTTTIEDYFTNPCTGSVQISTNGGSTWTEVGTLTNSQLVDGEQAIFDTTETDFIYRVIVTDTVTGCQFYNPAPDGSSAPVTYFILNDEFLSQFSGWTFDGTDLLDFRTNILPTLTNFLFDASVDEAGDSLYVAFSGVNAPTVTVVDAIAEPVTLDWITLTTKIPCLSATFTVIDPTDTAIQYLMIGSYIITASALSVTNPLCATEIQSAMRLNGFGSLSTVEINVAGSDVTIIFRDTNGLVTGIRWLDSAMNTGDETLSPC